VNWLLGKLVLGKTLIDELVLGKMMWYLFEVNSSIGIFVGFIGPFRQKRKGVLT